MKTATVVNAPTRKVANLISEGLSFTGHSHAEEIVASENLSDWRQLEDGSYQQEPPYTLTYVYDMVGNFETHSFDTIQELANAMREIADLRTWRKFDNEQ